ncbi:MAG: hypothetical protein IJZ06_08025 [Bacteroidales bacterium]|nr:hypothetical protein [Bacteroidales bacterium]
MAKGKAGIVTKESRKRSILKKKPVKLPSVVNGVKISDIPEKKKERAKFLQKELKRYQGKQLYCPALRSHVEITAKSISETKHHASAHINSTIAALNLRIIIKNAHFLKTTSVKGNSMQSKKMDLKDMITLICPLKKYGFAKLTVGKRYNNELVQYCITAIKLEWLKEE